MNYTKLQKTVASFLLPLFFFGLVFRFPFGDFFSSVSAVNPQTKALVSILVNEEVYDWVESRVERYAEDIQKQLEKTRVVIIPVPSDATVFEIASLNENLYYEWYNWLTWNNDFESELVWSVFIWNIPAPIVFDDNKSSQTIFPYTDFEDKQYIYNHENQRYEVNADNLNWLNAEIWHGLIVPNKDSIEEDIIAINDYFDKNHDFYIWEWNFTWEKGTTNWNKNEQDADQYKPYVFYFDEFREQASLSYSKYQWYEAYLENKEDINYSRYSKELAQSIQDRVLWSQNDEIKELIDDLDPNITDLSKIDDFQSRWPDISDTSAISTRFITNNVTKKFLEVLNSSTIGDFRKDVYNAWRYNWEGSKVNVDTIPYLVSVLDTIWDNVILWASNNLEEKIDELVKSGLSRKIVVPTSISSNALWGVSCSERKYTNFFYWKQWSQIETAKDCTIYRWDTQNWGTLVEANRGYNIDNVQPDIEICKNIWATSIWKTQGFWGGNSPLWFEESAFEWWNIELKSSNLDRAIRPIFDIKWAKKTQDETKVPTPLDCFENNYLLSYSERYEQDDSSDSSSWICVPDLVLPINWRAAWNWDCGSINRSNNFDLSFDENLQRISTMSMWNSCDIVFMRIGSKNVMRIQWSWTSSSDDDSCYPKTTWYFYKAIPSFIEHKAPTAEALGKQTSAMISPNLPINKDRYIDFISAKWEYVKIAYPYLYRIWDSLEYSWDFVEDYEKIKNLIREEMSSKSEEINTIIRVNNPDALSWRNKAIFEEYLQTGEYPNSNFSLQEFLPTQGNNFIQWWDQKDISYFDTLAFAIYWNNLESVSQKYKFIIDNYLSDQFESENNYALAKHKKSYEIAYLWAPWDAQNMYVTLDPENKGTNPYADIISQNLLLNSNLMSASLWGLSENTTDTRESDFVCAPPEWVPLWEWIPAVMCWLGDILPPKIKVSQNKCSTKSLFTENASPSWIYDFGQNDKDLEAWYCVTDLTNNGISDCLEEDLENANLQLKASTLQAWYGESIDIEAWIFDNENIALDWINHLGNIFELVSVKVPKDDSLPLGDNNALEVPLGDFSKYVSFKNTEIPLRQWMARYNFFAKNKDADITLRSRVLLFDIDGNLIKELQSASQTIQIRKTTFSLSSTVIDTTWSVQSSRLWIPANNTTNIFFHDANEESLASLQSRISSAWIAQDKWVFSLSKFDKNWNIDMSYPLTITLLQNGQPYREDIRIDSLTGVGFKWLYALSESSDYELIITDTVGKSVSKNFTILPQQVSNIDLQLWSTHIESQWNITNNILMLKDRFGNIVQWQPYEINMKLLRWGLVFPNDWGNPTSTKKIKVYNWLQVFRLKPTAKSAQNSLRIEVKTTQWSVVETVEINTLDQIKTVVEWPTNVSVWWWAYTFTLRFTDESGNILSWFNSRAYVKINSIYWSIQTPYIKIENGIAEVIMNTSTVSWKNIPLEFNVEGLSKTIRNNIDILPGKAMKMDLVLSDSKMQASPTSTWTLKVELKDRYNNKVFTDNSTTFTIDIEDKSERIITSSSTLQSAQNWEATFTLNPTSTPWTAYIKVTSDPDLKENTFTVGSWDNQIVVEWVWVNSTQMKSYYFWNKESIEGNNFNGLYSVLLGAPYWDFTQKDYLAGGLLFDRNNRSLVVTSLLNNPHWFADSVVFWKNWWAQKQSPQGDLSQDIELDVQLDQNNKMYIDIHNNAMNTYIWKVYYNFWDDVDIKTCVWLWNDFSDCWKNIEKTSITIKSVSQNHNVSWLNDGVITLAEKDWNELLSIDTLWAFELNPLVSLEIDTHSTQDELVLDIIQWDSVIWKIAINLQNHTHIVSRSIQQTLTNKRINKNSIIAEFNSYMYGTRDVYLDDGTKTLAIYYNDPFKDNKALDSFSSDSISWLESFQSEWSIGWKSDNKFLLSFAAGKNVWESLQDYASFWAVNLWDPVVSLKKNKQTFNNSTVEKSFDSTIWKLLTKEEVEAYQTFDYNNDWYEDILIIKGDWYLKILENKGGGAWFLDKWDVVYIADFWNSSYIKAWDFSGDWYWDIFFVNNKWEAYIFENNEKDFVRSSLEETFALNAKIVQVEIFDMDNDNKQDLVTLDDAWNINIFYWEPSSVEPKFTKKEISNWYWVKLNTESRTSGALVYFDGLVQVNQQDLLDKLVVENDNLSTTPTWENDWFIDKIMFEKITYSPWKKWKNIGIPEVIWAIPQLNASEFWTNTVDTSTALWDFLSQNAWTTTIQSTNHVDITTFIKSEYAHASWIEVSKKFVDVNWENLQSGDLVEVTITLKNTQWDKTWIAYVDSIMSPFEMSELRPDTRNNGVQRTAPAWYGMLIDDISLASWESTSITYTLRVLPITFGHIDVWLFEEGMVGDDLYWDIIIKADKQNCSQEVDMFASSSSTLRAYADKQKAAPRCDADKLKLPEDLEKNKIDSDNNGVPDYIDSITKNIAKQKEFAVEAFDWMKVDTDNDGIPDHEDETPKFNVAELGWILTEINENVDEMSAWIDTIIEWFGCGFWGDSCVSSPLNWAPLAPWQDPTLFGKPIWDWLKVWEGVPIFSAFNGMPVPVFGGCIEVPSVWPPFSDTFDWRCWWTSSAWWSRWTSSPTNFVRVFATPTLTWWAWVAVCFGGPAWVAGNSNPKGVSPLIPGWNCIVYAKPLLSCSNDWSEWDPESLGFATQYGWQGGFWVVNANCAAESNNKWGTWYGTSASLDNDFAKSYYNYKKTDTQSSDFNEKYKSTLINIADGNASFWNNTPLIAWWESWEYGFSVALDFSWNIDWNFEDVQQIQKQRVAGFPSFLMDWATRQIEEFVTKLTDFPTLFIILPDFGGIVDTDWGEQLDKTSQKFEEGKQTEENRIANVKSQIASINSRKSGLDCSWEDQIQCLTLDVQAWELAVETWEGPVSQGVWWAKKAFSGIRSVYDFLGNVPMVSVKPQQVNIEIPWVDQNTLNKTLLDWKIKQEQWKSQSIALEGSAAITAEAKTDYSKLISDLDKNIETLESYREIPAQLSTMFNKKEEWLGQILCNVESVSSLTWGWINSNGERFKAWVELYVLIKAILKSWQLLIDVFQDYDAECHECKNERNDLLNYEFKLIDMIIPKIPVIQFPKWPDIILDLHNVRAWLVVKVPDFNITQKPIVLPTLPELTLPSFDANVNGWINADFEFPSMPILPWFDIPELPDLPWIPTVELPNLPPPPTLPKLFASIEGVLKVLKLVIKSMCILKSSPFVPEWRAWDQIAFLTERKWYMPTDFLDLSLPEFSFPFVDAIKVTTWVNFEVETDFMVEMAKQVAEPINSTSSNIANKFSNAGLDSLDFSSYSQSINISENIDLNEANTWDISVGMFASIIAKWVLKVFSYIQEEQDETVNNKEFLRLVNESLSHESVTSNPRMNNIINLWDSVNKMTYHKEDMLIKDLEKNSDEKFEALTIILENEIEKTQNLKKDLETSTTPELFQKVVWEYESRDFVEYEETLSKYNKKFLESAKNLLENKQDSEITAIKQEWEKILSRVKGGLDIYKQWLTDYNDYIAQEKLLAEVTPAINSTGEVNSCQASNNSWYSYNYKWLYIVEKDKSYRMFDYIDELWWDEEFTSIDYDQDEDIDLLYLVNNQLFLKENISIQEPKTQSTETILKVRTELNKFLWGWEFVEAINGFRETNTDNQSINIGFNAPSNTNITHFVYEYYTLIDKFSSELLNDYTPAGVSKNVVEAFVSWNEQSVELWSDWSIERKHPATLNYVWNMRGVNFQTFEMIPLKSDSQTEISKWTRIYTSNRDVRIVYIDSDWWEQEKVIPQNTSLEFVDNVIITSIYAWSLYVKTDNIVSLKWTDQIGEYVGLPFFAESKIESIPDLRWSFSETSNIEITYASWKEPLSISFATTDSYEIYDLGQPSADYLITLDRANDFLYGKMYATYNGIKGTSTRQKLAGPQIQADTYAPELNYNQVVRIPVYQEKVIDFTDSVYENSWFSSIASVDVDFDLNSDSSWDGNPRNDNDIEWVKVLPLNSWKVRISFGEFDELFQKKIWITITDDNGNIWFKELDFEVYAPTPEIASQNESDIQWVLDEDLIWEPVNLYRLRGWSIKQLENITGQKAVDTLDDWVYNFNVSKGESWLTLMRADSVIATINEHTWKVTKRSLDAEVSAWTDQQYYPTVMVSDSLWELYKQSIKLLENREVIIEDDLENVINDWMYVSFKDNTNFEYYTIPTWVEHNGWALVLYKKWDVSKKSVVSFFPDWRIKGINELYALSYKDVWEYIWLDIVDTKSNTIIAKVLYKINWSYLMR